MLALRPNCECCNRDLPPDSTEARICSFECTFCASCADTVLDGVCPNCGGELVRRPRRPRVETREVSRLDRACLQARTAARASPESGSQERRRSSARISAVCSPSSGAGRRMPPGVADSRGTTRAWAGCRVRRLPSRRSLRGRARTDARAGRPPSTPGRPSPRPPRTTRGIGLRCRPMKAPIMASSSSRCCTRASLVAKRGSLFSSAGRWCRRCARHRLHRARQRDEAAVAALVDVARRRVRRLVARAQRRHAVDAARGGLATR